MFPERTSEGLRSVEEVTTVSVPPSVALNTDSVKDKRVALLTAIKKHKHCNCAKRVPERESRTQLLPSHHDGPRATDMESAHTRNRAIFASCNETSRRVHRRHHNPEPYPWVHKRSA